MIVVFGHRRGSFNQCGRPIISRRVSPKQALLFGEEAANGLKQRPRRWGAGADTSVTRNSLPGRRQADDSPVTQSSLRR
jgi:hypothetical protein